MFSVRRICPKGLPFGGHLSEERLSPAPPSKDFLCGNCNVGFLIQTSANIPHRRKMPPAPPFSPLLTPFVALALLVAVLCLGGVWAAQLLRISSV